MNRTQHHLVALLGAYLALIGSSHSARAESGGCDPDLNGNGVVEIADLLTLLLEWGPCVGCDADFNKDDVVDGEDLGYQFGHWGPCSENLSFPTPAQIELVVRDITDHETASQGLKEFDLFAAFDEPTHRLLNVLNANASCTEPPCWVDFQDIPSALPLSELIWDIFDLTYDCYVTVGTQFADDGALLGDPSLLISEQDFVEGTSLGPNAGWGAIPFNDQGLAGSYPNNQIRIASFTTPVGQTIEGELSIIYRNSAGQLFIGTETFVIRSANECPWDLNGDGVIGVHDLLILLQAWGPNRGHPADFDGDGNVGLSDLLAFLAHMGVCP